MNYQNLVSNMFLHKSKQALRKLMNYYSYRNITNGTVMKGTESLNKSTEENERRPEAKLKKSTNGFEITFPASNSNPDGMFFDYLWLRDHCTCSKCYNWKTFQKEVNYLDIATITPADYNLDAASGKLHVKWSDNHQSIYNLSWLQDNTFETYSLRKKYYRKIWNHGLLQQKDFPNVKYYPELKRTNFAHQVLHSLFKYGFCLIHNVAPTFSDTETVVRQISPIQKTYWGEMWSVYASESETVQDTAFTNIHIPPHNDCTYFNDSCGLNIFHCIQKATTGGETILVDGFHTAEILKKADQASYDYLSTTAIESSFQDSEGNCYLNYDTVIKHSPITKAIEQIRFNPLDLAPIRTIPQRDTRHFYRAYTAFTKLIYDHSNQITISLEPGTLLILDNWRVLHGRNAFTGNRSLCGCNISRTDYVSRLRQEGFI